MELAEVVKGARSGEALGRKRSLQQRRSRCTDPWSGPGAPYNAEVRTHN